MNRTYVITTIKEPLIPGIAMINSWTEWHPVTDDKSLKAFKKALKKARSLKGHKVMLSSLHACWGMRELFKSINIELPVVKDPLEVKGEIESFLRDVSEDVDCALNKATDAASNAECYAHEVTSVASEIEDAVGDLECAKDTLRSDLDDFVDFEESTVWDEV